MIIFLPNKIDVVPLKIPPILESPSIRNLQLIIPTGTVPLDQLIQSRIDFLKFAASVDLI